MKIALVCPYFPPHLGGIERVTEYLLHGYERAGHEARCLTSRAPAVLAPRDGAVVRIPCANHSEDHLGVPVPLWGLAGFRALREAAAWADAFHVIEALYQPSLLAVLAARRAGKPVVLTQNVGFIPYRSRILEVVERMAWRTLGNWVLTRADHVVLVTPGADHFVRGLLGQRLVRASTFPNGIDTELLRPASPGERTESRVGLEIPSERTVVLFAGRLVEKKGVPVVLETARRMPDVQFLVAGDGPLRGLLAHPPSNVRWLGFVDMARMPSLYRAADAVLLPSRGEGLPVFVQEAMACGLPAVISEDEVYARDLLSEGVAWGALPTPEAMAHRVRDALAADLTTRERARAYAVRNWGVGAMIERHVAIVRAIADERLAAR